MPHLLRAGLSRLAQVEERAGQAAAAWSHYAEAASVLEATGDWAALACVLPRLVELSLARGAAGAAVVYATRAMVLHHRLGSRDRERFAERLVQLRAQMPHTTFEDAFRAGLGAARPG